MAAGQWHTNPNTGMSGKCTAGVRGCPYGGGDNSGHYDSKEEAMAAYESHMIDSSIPQSQRRLRVSDTEHSTSTTKRPGLPTRPVTNTRGSSEIRSREPMNGFDRLGLVVEAQEEAVRREKHSVGIFEAAGDKFLDKFEATGDKVSDKIEVANDVAVELGSKVSTDAKAFGAYIKNAFRDMRKSK